MISPAEDGRKQFTVSVVCLGAFSPALTSLRLSLPPLPGVTEALLEEIQAWAGSALSSTGPSKWPTASVSNLTKAQDY